MNKREMSRIPTGNARKTTSIHDRYYVQCLTEQIFLVRERVPGQKTGPNDHIVRSFTMRYDAYSYVAQMNEQQKELDAGRDNQPQKAI